MAGIKNLLYCHSWVKPERSKEDLQIINTFLNIEKYKANMFILVINSVFIRNALNNAINWKELFHSKEWGTMILIEFLCRLL